MTTQQKHGVVLAGVDESGASSDVLRWAQQQAQLADARLKVIFVIEPFPPSKIAMPSMPDDELSRSQAELAKTLADECDPESGIQIEGVVVWGDPADVLIEASRQADLLVVGSRGRSALAGMLLGSVSSRCITHAFCPVVVVRPDQL